LPKRTPSAPDVSDPSRPPEILQFKVWLLGISPMVWWRVQVPDSMTLRELHGVIQVAMGWEGIHLFQFTPRAKRFGSLELAARSSDVPLSELRLRQGTRFRYEYDLNGPWEHEVRLEMRHEADPGMTDLRKNGMKPALIVDHLVGAYCPLVANDGSLSDQQKADRVRRFARQVTGLAYGQSGQEELDVLVDVPLMPALLGQVDQVAGRAGMSRDAWIEQAIKQSLTVP
jgi:hypothetical protein